MNGQDTIKEDAEDIELTVVELTLLEKIEDLCASIIDADRTSGYERMANAMSELAVAINLSEMDDSIPAKSAHDLATARTFRLLRKVGMASKEAEIRSGFGDARDNLHFRGLAPGEEIDLPAIGPEHDVDEREEARAYYILLKWLSAGKKPFWEARIDGCLVRVDTRESDPTVLQVGWYGDHGNLISNIEFDLRFCPRRYRI